MELSLVLSDIDQQNQTDLVDRSRRQILSPQPQFNIIECEDDCILLAPRKVREPRTKRTEDNWDVIRSSLLRKLPEVKGEYAKQAQFML